ncbi:hypothetical protein [Bacillus sp. SM2101]|uniref:hypothetical protein n=1 Tax=Bacillus sp. SM2101 TaxID=2805366 RepID=UPI001BDE7099|nr:hypothetical protein [Bacillus sp. SM2101]
MFFIRSSYDERLVKRYRGRAIQQVRKNKLKETLHQPHVDQLFKQMGLPDYITSLRVNQLRLVLMLYPTVGFIIEMISDTDVISNITAISLAIIAIQLEPRRYFAMYYILTWVRKSYNAKKNNEVYQLFTDIKSEFITKQGQPINMYHLMYNLIPYYETIKATLEKMLPYLRDKKQKEAWDLFEEEIGTKEAKNLAIVMMELENVEVKEAAHLLENRREEFSNSIINAYKDHLFRKRGVIFVVLAFGAVVVFLNPVAGFWVWYKEVMSTVNNF